MPAPFGTLAHPRLSVLVSADCPSCDRARAVAQEVGSRVPEAVVDVVDVDFDGVPDGLPYVGTPSYYVNARLISLGNPEPGDLVTILAGARR